MAYHNPHITGQVYNGMIPDTISTTKNRQAYFFEHVMNASAIVLILSRWWFQLFLVSPLSGEMIQFD